MKFVSFCSGIEAASVACRPLGWECVGVSEIDPFARAVLAHRQPDAPDLGDMTTLLDDPVRMAQLQESAPDVAIAGCPCQSFSIAGLRKGLTDDRGNLTLDYVLLIRAIRSLRWAVYENVPGILSDRTNAFGCLLAGLVGGDAPLVPPGKLWWATAGVVNGPDGTAAWRTLDSQFFGVAQRRRRVFVVFSRGAGNWGSARALFPVAESLRGDPAPRREARQVSAAGTLRSTDGGSDTDHARAGHVVPALANALQERYWRGADSNTQPGQLIPELSPTLRAGGNKTGGDRPPGTDVDTCETLIPTLADPLVAKEGATYTHEGSNNFRVRNVVGQPMAIQERAISENPANGPDGVGVRTDGVAYTLESRQVPQAIAFSAKDHGADAGELSPTLRAMPHDGSHANGGGKVAVAVHENQRSEVTLSDTAGSLKVQGGKPGQGYPAVLQMRVRRLTPEECETLQGFPREYTKVPFRGKPAEKCPDGPRYKTLGNTMTVQVIRFLGRRIEEAERPENA